MTFFDNKRKYIVSILVGLAIGMALVAGGILAYNSIYPENTARAGIESDTQTNLNPTVLPTDIPGIVNQVSDAVVYLETTVENKTLRIRFLMTHFLDTFWRQLRFTTPKSK